jgi:hypothetical protein
MSVSLWPLKARTFQCAARAALPAGPALDLTSSQPHYPGVDRRRFLSPLAGALAGPLAVEAQQKQPQRVAFLTLNQRSTAATILDALSQGFSDLGTTTVRIFCLSIGLPTGIAISFRYWLWTC